jgi:hypothetical protein
MSREQDNKGNPWNPKIIDELAAPDILLQYSLHAPRRGRDDVRDFMVGFREAFPDLNFWGAVAVLRVEDGKIVEEIGLHDGVTALQKLGILKAA